MRKKKGRGEEVGDTRRKRNREKINEERKTESKKRRRKKNMKLRLDKKDGQQQLELVQNVRVRKRNGCFKYTSHNFREKE